MWSDEEEARSDTELLPKSEAPGRLQYSGARLFKIGVLLVAASVVVAVAAMAALGPRHPATMHRGRIGDKIQESMWDDFKSGMNSLMGSASGSVNKDDIEAKKDSIQDAAGDAQDSIEDAAGAAQDKVNDATDKAKDAVDSSGIDDMDDMADSVKEKIEEKIDKAKDKAEKMLDSSGLDDMAESAKKKIESKIDKAKEKAEKLMDSTGIEDMTKSAKKKIESKIDEAEDEAKDVLDSEEEKLEKDGH